MSDQPRAAIGVISNQEVTPDNAETRSFLSLIGRPLTRIEFREHGEVYLEFEPYGSLTIRPELTQSVHASLAPERTQ